MTKALTYIEIDIPEFTDADVGEKAVVAGTEFDFDTDSLQGWTGGNATLTASPTGMIITPTSADPQALSPTGLTLNGAIDRYVQIDVERTVARSSGAWDGRVFYVTSGHGFSGSFFKNIPELENVVGARRTYQLDMHDLSAGGVDWAENTITRIRLDFDNSADSEVKVHSVTIGPRLQTWRFAMPTGYLPPEIDCIPSIDSVSFTPARVSLGKDLGERASLKISLRDHKHIMNGEPFDQGTFFGKWRGRYGTKLRGRELRLIRGQVGQTIEQMDTRYYVIENTDGPDFGGVYTIEAKDILKLADDDRAQYPALSNGSLLAPLDNSETSATLNPAGIGDLEYPASGWVCLGGKEVVGFTRSGDALTISRGQFGTVAQSHDSGDRVQVVARFAGDDAADILNTLFTSAGVPAGYINLAEWQQETAGNLGVLYVRTITEPTSVRKLVSELIEQAALAVWWDDRARQLRLNVLREISTDNATFGPQQILEGTFQVKEQPAKRISQIWTYYGQRDPTDSSAERDNYRAVVADVDLPREAEYGSAEIRQINAQWIETEVAATRLNAIQLSRFRDPPRSFAFEVFRDVAIIPAAGYQLEWWGNQDDTGVEQPALIQITHVRLEADRVYVEAEEMLASGVISLVNVVFLLDAGVLSDFEVPATWNDADNAIHVIAGGGAGAGTPHSNDGRKGGGGGAYSRVENVSLTPLSTVPYFVGRGGLGVVDEAGGDGEDTWFGHATYAGAIVAARRGQGGAGRNANGQGGQAAEGIGDVRFSGGDGADGGNASGSNRSGGGGGGGSGGPNGDGANGGTVISGTSGGRGGGGGGGANGGSVGQTCQSPFGAQGGNNRFGFGGGNDAQPTGQESGGGRGADKAGEPNSGGNGGNGEQLWTQTVAPIISAGPGGGGGGGGTGRSGRDGGLYGGGGGGTGRGSGLKGGNGRQGIIVLTWREAVGSPA